MGCGIESTISLLIVSKNTERYIFSLSRWCELRLDCTVTIERGLGLGHLRQLRELLNDRSNLVYKLKS